MLSKQSYRLKCRVLAHQVAKMKLRPCEVNSWLSKQRWFMQLNGLNGQGKNVKLSKKGALARFGQEWCDRCWVEELVNTGIYTKQNITNNPEDLDTFYPYNFNV